MKKLFAKPIFKNIISPIVRGVVKSVPFGGVAVEAIKNITHEVKAVKGTLTPKPLNDTPHNYLSVIVQALCVAAVVYAFVTKAITVEQLLKFFGFAV